MPIFFGNNKNNTFKNNKKITTTTTTILIIVKNTETDLVILVCCSKAGLVSFQHFFKTTGYMSKQVFDTQLVRTCLKPQNVSFVKFLIFSKM